MQGTEASRDVMVMVVGASGAAGRALVPKLVAAGHEGTLGDQLRPLGIRDKPIRSLLQVLMGSMVELPDRVGRSAKHVRDVGIRPDEPAAQLEQNPAGSLELMNAVRSSVTDARA